MATPSKNVKKAWKGVGEILGFEELLEFYNVHTEPELENIFRKYIRDPRLQLKIPVNIAEILGNVSLAFYRGRQVGIHDAYLALAKEHPIIANKILKHFHMNKEGSIGIR